MTPNIVRVGNDKVELHTSRLRLRGATTNDPEYLYHAFSDAEVMKYWCVWLVANIRSEILTLIPQERATA
jgi:hypothetical protein